MSLVQRISAFFTRASRKISVVIDRIRNRSQRYRDIAIVQAEVALKWGDRLQALEPEDIPLLYSAVTNYIVDAQAEGILFSLAGQEKFLIVQKLLRESQYVVRVLDDKFDIWWEETGSEFLEDFIEKAKELEVLNFSKDMA